MAGGGAAVTDVSSAWTVLRLVGPRVRSLLEELVVSDVSADAIADLEIFQVAMANCRVVMARRDLGAVPGFTLLVVRDEAEHLWDVLVERGAAHGLRPVGGLALTANGPVGEGAQNEAARDDASRDEAAAADAARDAAAPDVAFGTAAPEPPAPNRTFRPRPQRPRPGTQDDNR